MYYSDEIIEEVRQRNDIVDVISGYVKLQKKGIPGLDCAPSTMRRPLLFPSAAINRCIIVLAAGLGATCLPLSWSMRTTPLPRR